MLKFWQRWWLCSLAVVLEVLLVQVLALTAPLVQALGPGSSRRGKRRWRRWLMPPLAQFPLLVERRRVEREKPLVRVVGLVSRLLWRDRSSRCSLGCPPCWLLVTLARFLALMLVLVIRVLEWANHLRLRWRRCSLR